MDTLLDALQLEFPTGILLYKYTLHSLFQEPIFSETWTDSHKASLASTNNLHSLTIMVLDFCFFSRYLSLFVCFILPGRLTKISLKIYPMKRTKTCFLSKRASLPSCAQVLFGSLRWLKVKRHRPLTFSQSTSGIVVLRADSD